MSNFNHFAPQQPQHPITTQFNPANSSVTYETTTLSPQATMSQLNTSGPGFNYQFCNPQQSYIVSMSSFQCPTPIQPNMAPMVPVPGTSNMSPPLLVFQSPSPLHFVNPYYQQTQPGFSTPVAVGQINGQIFPVPLSENLQIVEMVETQSQQSSGSSEQTIGRTIAPHQEPVLPPSPPAAPAAPSHSVRPPPGFRAKPEAPLRRPKSRHTSMSWSQRVTKKKPVSKPTVPTPKRQPSCVKKESSRKVIKNEGRKKRTKYGYRSKQNKIDTVHENLEKRYAARGILANKEDVLRGDDVLRLHVKKFDALTKIEHVLETAEKLPGVSLKSVSIPLSMKNEFQKKGFLVYCQLSDVKHVETVKNFFQSYPEFAKCQIAMPNPGNEGEPDYASDCIGEPAQLHSLETGSLQFAGLEKISTNAPLNGEKDDLMDEKESLALVILPMTKTASLASVGC